MKKILFIMMTVFIMLFFVACNGGERKSFFEKSDFSGEVEKIILKSSKSSIIPNNNDEVIFYYELLNQFDEKINKDNVEIFVNNNKITGNTFKTDEEGTYTIYAQVNELRSESIILNAKSLIENISFDIEEKILFKSGIQTIYKLGTFEHKVESINFEVETSDDKYFYQINSGGWKSNSNISSFDLKVGNNLLEITKDIDGNSKYKYSAYRKSNDIYLSNLEILNVENFNFISSVNDYLNEKVISGKDFVRLIPTTNNSNSKIEINIDGKWQVVSSGNQSNQINLNSNETEILIKVTAEDTSINPNIYNIIVNKKSFNELKSLKILKSGVDILENFDPKVTDYEVVVVDYDTDNIEIEAIVDSNYSITGDLGINDLEVGNNKFNIYVSESGENTTYEVNIYRKNNNSNIKNIKIDKEEQNFDDNNELTYTINDITNKIEFDILLEDKDNAKLIYFVDGNELSESISNQEIEVEDVKTIKIKVIAEDIKISKEYTIKINVASIAAELNYIKVDEKDIYNLGDYSYPLESVSNDTDFINLKIKKKSETQEVSYTINNSSLLDLSSDIIEKISLEEGNNNIIIYVESNSGDKNEYTINIRRKTINTELETIKFDKNDYKNNNNSFDLGNFDNTIEELVIEPALNFKFNSTVKYKDGNKLLDLENGTFILDLEYGDNSFTLIVYSEEENAEETEYTVKAYRESGITGLKKFLFNDEEFKFGEEDNGIIDIEVGDVLSETLNIKIEFIKENTKVKVYDKNDNKIDLSTKLIELEEFGNEIITLKVESEDGLNKKYYNIKFNLIEDKPLDSIEEVNIEFKNGNYVITCSNVLNAEEYEFFIDTSNYGSFNNSLGTSSSGSTGVIFDEWEDDETYYIKVIAKNGAGKTVESKATKLSTGKIVSKPFGLNVTKFGDTYLDLEWDSSDSGIKYRVYVDQKMKKEDISTKNTRIDGLSPNTTYDVKVEAYNDISDNKFTNEEEYTTNYSTSGLTAPKDFNLKHNGDGKYKISCDDVSASKYEFYMTDRNIYMENDYSNISSFDDFGIGSSYNYNYKDNISLDFDKTYYFYIVVSNNTSKVLSQRFQEKTDKKVYPVTGVEVKEITNKSIILSWNPVDGVDGYNIRNNSETEGFLKNVSSGTTETTIDNLTEDTSYNLVIEAYNEKSQQEFTRVDSFRTLKKVGEVSSNSFIQKNQTEITIDLKWDSLGSDVKYDIYEGYTNKATDITGDSYTIRGLSANKTYDFKIVAKNSFSSSTGTTKTFYTKVSAPSGLSGSSTRESITVKWTQVSGVKYNVYLVTSKETIKKTSNPISGSEYTISSEISPGNSYTVKVEAVNEVSTNDATIPIETESLSSNTNISSLEIENDNYDNISVNFYNSTSNYTLANQLNDVNKIRFDISLEDYESELKITKDNSNYNNNSFINIDTGNNTFYVVVTAEDGTEKKYTFNIYREKLSDNTEIKKVRVIGSYTETIEVSNVNSTNTTYDLGKVSSTVNSISLEIETVEEVKSISNYQNITLIDGSKEFEVRVTAKDGSYDDYKFKIYRKSGVAELSGLSVSSGISLSKVSNGYKAENISNNINSITITPTVISGSKTTVYYEGSHILNVTNAGSFSVDLSTTQAETIVKLNIVAEDTDIYKEVYVTFVKEILLEIELYTKNNKTEIMADNSDSIEFNYNIDDQFGGAYALGLNIVDLYVGSNKLSEKAFKTSNVGEFECYVSFEGFESNRITIKSNKPEERAVGKIEMTGEYVGGGGAEYIIWHESGVGDIDAPHNQPLFETTNYTCRVFNGLYKGIKAGDSFFIKGGEGSGAITRYFTFYDQNNNEINKLTISASTSDDIVRLFSLAENGNDEYTEFYFDGNKVTASQKIK